MSPERAPRMGIPHLPKLNCFRVALTWSLSSYSHWGSQIWIEVACGHNDLFAPGTHPHAFTGASKRIRHSSIQHFNFPEKTQLLSVRLQISSTMYHFPLLHPQLLFRLVLEICHHYGAELMLSAKARKTMGSRQAFALPQAPGPRSLQAAVENECPRLLRMFSRET